MTTSLKFEAPADLSVGQIRISDADGVQHEWIATPEQRDFSTTEITPGFYFAEIEPAGVNPNSIVFEVRSGQANTVSVPDFSYLALSGGGTTFVGVDDHKKALTSLFGSRSEAAFKLDESSIRFVSDFHRQSIDAEVSVSSSPSAASTRLLSIGLSMEALGRREGWEAFTGGCSAQLVGGAVALDIVRPDDWSASSGRRARLTVAIEGVRIERLLLPLYRGGTTVRVTPSAISASDVALEVTPSDPSIRALWRAIDAGTREHAIAVRDQILRVKGPEPISALEAADPWEAMLAGLLYLRFPDEFGLLSASWVEALCCHYPWAADCYVIRAKQAAAAVAADPDNVAAQAALAVRMLVKAQARGSPYFTMANQVFNELVESLVDFDPLPDSARAEVKRAQIRWQRELPLQRSAGTTFSWLSRDPIMLKKAILAPKRNVSGRLGSRDTSVVFKGLVKGGGITFETTSAVAPKSASVSTEQASLATNKPNEPWNDTRSPIGCPALSRSPGPSDDPNKGRFGREATRNGFTLSARFPEGNPRFVSVQLVVEASESAQVTLGDSVWFCLHPTFNPEWVRVFFQGRTASLTVRAWGGFTVGAWLPAQAVELECDLADAKDAPAIIRNR